MVVFIFYLGGLLEGIANILFFRGMSRNIDCGLEVEEVCLEIDAVPEGSVFCWQCLRHWMVRDATESHWKEVESDIME